mmetsp:Transcript_37599/g.94532  ORF Transcript_37599/g.94532 Transcript_37599/m.94532 type:complete len:347 (+) Transcript_37599:1208-2248(+)|eukprot:CAMPEP_0177665212 /NCGR_PEP_ID=MMETSP0447-20121125/20928_1 /TAXON_ID=0 /ORGANISM="Stygamoeba regulata, Strain BSH-02190019" /LENGTH=346 /DNA_ID=CAMNT_0019171279 /DNA_START=91 /DNA_END=1131 /DNA_ORIENTATION=+
MPKVLKQKKKLPPILEWGKAKADVFVDEQIMQCKASSGKKLNLTNWKLVFKGTILNTLPTAPWADLSAHLQALEIDGHYLTTLPAELVNLKRLKLISIQKNQFTSIPEVITKITSLIAIRVGHNPFEPGFLPETLTNLKNLKHIEAANCNLTGLPAVIKKIPLEKIDLSSNPLLNAFPADLCDIPSLSTLKINDCKLVSIPEDIGKLKKLTELHVCKNKLRTLPTAVCQLTKLKHLTINSNPFKIARLNELSHDENELLRYVKTDAFIQASSKLTGASATPIVPASSAAMDFESATHQGKVNSAMTVNLDSNSGGNSGGAVEDNLESLGLGGDEPDGVPSKEDDEC